MGKDIHDRCGCVHDGTTWLSQCDKHQQQSDAYLQELENSPPGTFKPTTIRRNGKIVLRSQRPVSSTTAPVPEVQAPVPPPAEADVVKVKAPRQPRSSNVPKLQQAMNLYKTLQDRSRKAVIRAFTEHLDMTIASASAYENKIKKMVIKLR
jgi:hypothetical protein